MSVKLIDYLPEDYKKSVSVVELQEIFDKEKTKVTNTEEDMQQQLHLATATWGLAAWETVYGLPVDTTKTETTRRAAVMARMGGTDTTRPITVKEVSEKFLQGKVAVFEVNAEYRFEVHFLEVLQKGQNVEDLKRVIDEMKPAHLDYAIILKYNTWGDLQEKCKTWKRVKEKTWSERKDERIMQVSDTEPMQTKEKQMATTPNYHLNLPSLDDVADITKIAENFTEIDKILKADEKRSIAKDIGYTDNQNINATNVQDAIDNVAIKAAKALEIAEKALQTMEDLFYVIGVLPSQSGSLTYTGSTLSPSWTNYDSAKLTLGSTTSAINAGNYTATFTPKGKYKWSNGTQTPVTVQWVIDRAVVAVPTQSGSLTYTGSTLTPSWSNYDSQKLIPGGTTYAVNAGTYTATFTPKSNYKFSDGVTTAKIVYWKIAKAAGSLSLNKTSLSIGTGNMTGTIAVTRTGDGAISATSSSTSVATCSVSGTTVTVTAKATGSATITVKVAAGTNHNAPASEMVSVVSKVYNPTLAANSWAQIAEASAAGKASAVWNVGDTKDIVVNGETFTFAIMGFGHDDLQSGGKAGITFGMKNAMKNKLDHGMNYSSSNQGGFTGSAMYRWLQNTLFNSLPADLQSVIKMVNKKTSAGDASPTIETNAMKLFLFSEQEIFGSKINSYGNEGVQYKYFATAGNRIKYIENEAGSPTVWWQRSPYTNARHFCYVNSKGESDTNNSEYLYDICFGFCV